MRMKDKRGVSPVIATILLIALTIVAVGIVAAFMGTISLGGVSYVSYDNTSSPNTLTLKNSGADIDKSKLRLLVDDEIVLDVGHVGTGTWSTGQNFTISLPAGYTLGSGKTIKLVDTVQGRVILEVTL